MLEKVRGKKVFRSFEDKFEDLFDKIFMDVYVNDIDDNSNPPSLKSKYSEFLFENKNIPNFKFHPLYKGINTMHLIFKDKTLLESLKNSDLLKNMDNALSLFVFSYWSFNGTSENMMNIRISFLFREFLNFIGWDHLQLLANYKIIDHHYVNRREEYTKVMLSENLPELIDDFVGVFLKKDAPGFTNNLSEVKYFITEFCNFIYNESIINYMVEPVE